jgi:DnaJ-class molecular chaperone
MEITLEEAFAGKTAEIRADPVTCETCSGTGAKAGTKPKTCATCGGHGRVRARRASSRSSAPARPARAAAGDRRPLPLLRRRAA